MTMGEQYIIYWWSYIYFKHFNTVYHVIDDVIFIITILVLHEGLLHMSLSAVSQNFPLSRLFPDHAVFPHSFCLL